MLKLTNLLIFTLFVIIFPSKLSAYGKCNPNDFLTEDGSCLPKCPFPLLQLSLKYAKMCKSPCKIDEFVYPDGTCLKECPVPLLHEEYGRFKLCKSLCGPKRFLMPDGSCKKDCLAPYTAFQSHQINTCVIECPTNQYLDVTGKCQNCPLPKILKEFCCGLRSCVNPCEEGQFYHLIKQQCVSECGPVYKQSLQSGVPVCDKPCSDSNKYYDETTGQCLDTCPPFQWKLFDNIINICSQTKGGLVAASIRFETTREEFDNNGGVSGFISKVASVLQISTSLVRVTDIRVGSVIIDLEILAAGGYTTTEILTAIADNLLAAINSGAFDVFGPVIDQILAAVPPYQGISPCPQGQFLDTQGICVDNCGSIWTTSTYNGLTVCVPPCPSDQFYFNYAGQTACLTECTSPKISTTIEGVQACQHPCPAPDSSSGTEYFWREDLSTCETTCTAPWGVVAVDYVNFCRCSSNTFKLGACVENCGSIWVSEISQSGAINCVSPCPGYGEIVSKIGDQTACTFECLKPKILQSIEDLMVCTIVDCPVGEFVREDTSQCQNFCDAPWEVVVVDTMNVCKCPSSFYGLDQCLEDCPPLYLPQTVAGITKCVPPCFPDYFYIPDQRRCSSECPTGYDAVIEDQIKVCRPAI